MLAQTVTATLNALKAQCSLLLTDITMLIVLQPMKCVQFQK